MTCSKRCTQSKVKLFDERILKLLLGSFGTLTLIAPIQPLFQQTLFVNLYSRDVLEAWTALEAV